MEGDNPSGKPPLTLPNERILFRMMEVPERFMGGYNTWSVRLLERDWDYLMFLLDALRLVHERAEVLHDFVADIVTGKDIDVNALLVAMGRWYKMHEVIAALEGALPAEYSNAMNPDGIAAAQAIVPRPQEEEYGRPN